MKKQFSFITLFLAVLYKVSFAQWTGQTSGTTQHLNSIYATSTASVFAVGNNGAGIKTTNSGSSWGTMNLNSTLTHYSVRFFNANNGMTVGDGQEVLTSSNAGGLWINIDGGVTALYDCYPTSSFAAWVVGDIEVGYGFLYSPYSSSLIQISAIANKVLRGIYFANSTTGWVVGDAGLIIKTTNSGTNWTQQTSGIVNQLNKVAFIDANNGIAVGNTGAILRTINGGTSWNLANSNTTENLNAVYYADASNVWACGDNGTILKSTDGGINWATENSGTTQKLNGIHGFGTSNVWACGNNGTLLYRSSTPTSVFENHSQLSCSIYPNPSNGMLTVETENESSAEVEIYNVMGELVFQGKLSDPKTEINLPVSKGVYSYHLKNEEQLIKKGKLVIQ